MNYLLPSSIIEMSSAKNWDDAKSEWLWEDTFICEEYETCLCGHYPIKKMIVLKN